MKEQCLEIALQYPDKSPRELAWTIIDEHRYFISESSVYRLLKQYDLITSPAYILMQAVITLLGKSQLLAGLTGGFTLTDFDFN